MQQSTGNQYVMINDAMFYGQVKNELSHHHFTRLSVWVPGQN